MERLVLVHGSVLGGEATWSRQASLADRYELVVLNRPGFPPGPPVERIDFVEDGRWLAERLEPGDHLAGHSYGGVICLYAAAAAPALASLTLVEPPAFGIAAADPAVAAFIERVAAHWAAAPREPRAFLEGFLALVGSPLRLPDPLPPALEQGARLLMVERGPQEAEPPLDALDALPFPKLVVSGGHHAAFEAVCDVLERRLHAERAVVEGAGHAIPAAAGFNEVLADFLGRSA